MLQEIESVVISLKAARVNAEMTQSELAKTLGITKSTIIKWEKGDTSPNINQARKIGEILKFPYNNIFFGSKSTLSVVSNNEKLA